jgi:hypothetical protein
MDKQNLTPPENYASTSKEDYETLREKKKFKDASDYETLHKTYHHKKMPHRPQRGL